MWEHLEFTEVSADLAGKMLNFGVGIKNVKLWKRLY